MTAIICEHVYAALAGTPVLQDVSFSLSPHSRMSILGPSGAGKTTLLRVLAGLETPEKGTIQFDGQDASKRRAWCAMVFQKDALFPHTRIKDNIAYGLHKLGYDRTEITQAVGETAEMLKIGHLLDRYPASLSGGERQRAGIARALVRKPKILLMDEPFASLDTRLKEELQKDLLDIFERSEMTWIEVTHDQKEAVLMGEKIMLLNGGRVQCFGDPDTLRSDPPNLFTASFFDDPQPNILECEIKEGKLTLWGRTLFTDHSDGKYTVSLRPQQIHMDEHGNMHAVTAGVIRHGSDWLCSLIAGGESISVLSEKPCPVGETVRLLFADSDLCFFAGESGQRVRIQFREK